MSEPCKALTPAFWEAMRFWTKVDFNGECWTRKGHVMATCHHCGGAVIVEYEHDDGRATLVAKCFACARPARGPRPHEEPRGDAEVSLAFPNYQ